MLVWIWLIFFHFLQTWLIWCYIYIVSNLAEMFFRFYLQIFYLAFWLHVLHSSSMFMYFDVTKVSSVSIRCNYKLHILRVMYVSIASIVALIEYLSFVRCSVVNIFYLEIKRLHYHLHLQKHRGFTQYISKTNIILKLNHRDL